MTELQAFMSQEETAELKRLENVIARGLRTFVEVGQALAEIRTKHLYAGTHTTFDHYCRERWGMSRSYAHRTIEAAQVTAMLPIGNAPRSEAVARELAPLRSDPVLLEKVWSTATAEHDKPTAMQVRAIRRKESPNGKPTRRTTPATKAGKPTKTVEDARVVSLGRFMAAAEEVATLGKSLNDDDLAAALAGLTGARTKYRKRLEVAIEQVTRAGHAVDKAIAEAKAASE